MNLQERVEALTSRNSEPIPYSDAEAKDAFIELLAEGKFPEEAARLVSRTATWFRRRRNPEAVNYDASFRERYEQVMVSENQVALTDRLRMLMMKAAEGGDVRAIEKLLMAYDPDFNFMRPQAVGGGVNIATLKMYFSQLPSSDIEALIAKVESAQKALPVIDA